MECLVIFGYKIKPERIAEFEVTYSVTGAWANLLRTMPGYLGTRLLCEGDGHYATIDLGTHANSSILALPWTEAQLPSSHLSKSCG